MRRRCRRIQPRLCAADGSHHALLGFERAGTAWRPVEHGSSLPIAVSGVGGVQAIATGAFHTCALMADATVTCWGSTSSGQLGSGTTPDSATPVAAACTSNATAIAGGAAAAGALLADRSLQCWGDNYEGQLGDGTGTPSLTPVHVAGIGSAVDVVAGWAHTCARLSGGTVQCWGEGTSGELGNGAMQNALAPVSVSGIGHAVGLPGGWWQHSCVLRADGRGQIADLSRHGEQAVSDEIEKPAAAGVEQIQPFRVRPRREEGERQREQQHQDRRQRLGRRAMEPRRKQAFALTGRRLKIE